MKRRLSFAFALVAITTSLWLPAHAHGCGIGTAYLSDDPDSGSAARYYWAVEGENVVSYIARGGHDCDPAAASVDFLTVEGSAFATDDYTPPDPHPKTISLGSPNPLHSVWVASQSIPTTQDDAVESVESFTAKIQNPSGDVTLGFPREVPAHIVDDDGPERFAFERTSFAASESGGSVQIAVFRAGVIPEGGSIGYTVTPGTAGTADYTAAASGAVSFVGLSRVAFINVGIVNDSLSEAEETFTVALEGDAGIVTVSITDNEEKTAPVSRFHHPRQNIWYAYGDYRLREVHVFTSDVGSGTWKAQWALRRNMLSGACQWWNGSSFVSGACSANKWLAMKKYDPEFFYYRLPRIRSSVGTGVKNYTAFSRAFDLAGNVESTFTVGRNRNTFEVKRP